MPTHTTNAGRDAVDVHLRLDKVVLTVRSGEDTPVEAPLTPDEARRVAEWLADAAASADRNAPA